VLGYDSDMKRWLMTGLLLMFCTHLGAQEGTARAWQQRLKLEEPLPVPVLAVRPANPFALRIDVGPRLLTAVPPRKLPVTGTAKVAVYVDAGGISPGALPLELPFPGLTQELLTALKKTKFEPGRANRVARPSWVVLEVKLAGKIKESAVVKQDLRFPDPAAPPAPPAASPPYPPGRLAALPAADAATLTNLATPRRLKVRVPGHQAQVGIHALVHFTADGRADRFVPLGMQSGLVAWLSTYLASWKVQPAQLDAKPVPCWMQYTARVMMKFSRLSSSSVRVVAGERFTPSGRGSSDATPGGE